MSPRIAYLSGSKLHVLEGEAPPRVLESPFGQKVRERAVKSAQKNSWKAQGSGAQFMNGGMLWGSVNADPAAVPVVVTSLTRGREQNHVLYSLFTDAVSGIFAMDVQSGEEKRLVHQANQRVQQPAAHPASDLIACSVFQEGGSSNIAVMSADGSEIHEITEGDSIDVAPAWVPGQPTKLVFQSAGIGRGASGEFMEIGPAHVQEVDVRSGEMRTLAEEAEHDLLCPRPAEDGSLYFIRRPRTVERPSFLKFLLDLVLLPFRLLFAVFSFLNFFTLRYTGKPLNTSDGARQRTADMRRMLIWGNLAGAHRAAVQEAHAPEAEPPAVPSSWKLVRQTAEGQSEVLADGVLSFDVAQDGTVAWTDGCSVFVRTADGQKKKICSDREIAQVALW